MGIVHFLEAPWIAKKMTFLADSSVGNSLHFLMAFLITTVQRLDGVSRVNRLPDFLWVVKQRIEINPVGCPGPADLRVLSVPLSSELP